MSYLVVSSRFQDWV